MFLEINKISFYSIYLVFYYIFEIFSNSKHCKIKISTVQTSIHHKIKLNSHFEVCILAIGTFFKDSCFLALKSFIVIKKYSAC